MFGTYAKDREVEKRLPFADRARKTIRMLEGLRTALNTIGYDEGSALMRASRDAIELLNEAITRGVKGKEPK